MAKFKIADAVRDKKPAPEIDPRFGYATRRDLTGLKGIILEVDAKMREYRVAFIVSEPHKDRHLGDIYESWFPESDLEAYS